MAVQYLADNLQMVLVQGMCQKYLSIADSPFASNFV